VTSCIPRFHRKHRTHAVESCVEEATHDEMATEAVVMTGLQNGAYTKVLVLLGRHTSPLGGTVASLRQALRPTVTGSFTPTASIHSGLSGTPLQPVVAMLRQTLSSPVLPLPVHALVPLLSERKQLLRAVTESVDGCISGSWAAPLVELNGNFNAAQCDACTRMYEHSWLERVLSARGLPTCSLCGSLVTPTAFSGANVVTPNQSAEVSARARGRHAVWDLLDVDAKQCDLLLCLGVAGQEQAWRRVMSVLPGATPVFLVGCEEGLQEHLERFRLPTTSSRHATDDSHAAAVDPYADDFPDSKVDELLHFADSDLSEGVIGHASQSLLAVGLNSWDRFLADCLFEDEETALQIGSGLTSNAALDSVASMPSTVLAWNRPVSESVHDLIHALGVYEGVVAHLDTATKKQAARLAEYAAEQASIASAPITSVLDVPGSDTAANNASPLLTSRPLALSECLAPVPEQQQVAYSQQVDGAGVGIFAQANADFDDLDALLAAEREKSLTAKPSAASMTSPRGELGTAYAGCGVPESKTCEGKEGVEYGDEKEWEALMHQLASTE
jgi:hypothetical protein